jgi:adenine-specific DNA-methyltransferase
VSDSSLDAQDLRQVSYLTEQIIPYIGNKRRLLPLIHRALTHVFPDGFNEKTFLDPFAGSGVVSRFAKYLGFEVFSNDWEHYAYLICFAFLKVNLRDLEHMFAPWGGMEGILNHLNSLPPPLPEAEFIARHYCPRVDSEADYRTERLFYTRENGLIIDKIRNEIEALFPFPLEPAVCNGAYAETPANESAVTDSFAPEGMPYREKVLLLALLIQMAATHTNTSGVFKAYHKGFGGFSGDALNRILKPIAMKQPKLWDSSRPQHVFKMDAAKLLKHMGGRVFDIAYLDPPYNQHQYGSNYHLLNTIALWDKVSPGSRETGGKAGIRRDWVLTRSDYCYHHTAANAFASLLEELAARYIFISYSTEGIIPFDVLMGLCAAKGKVNLFTDEYVKYRGGRQSNHRLNHNVEFVVIIDTARQSVRSDLDAIEERLLERRLGLQIRHSYMRDRLRKYFVLNEQSEALGFDVSGSRLWIETQGYFRLKPVDLNGMIDELNLQPGRRKEAKEKLLHALQQCQCSTRVEELRQILLLMKLAHENALLFAEALPGLLRKIAHRKYKSIFTESLADIRAIQRDRPELFERIAEKIDDVELLAMKRFQG